MRLSALAKKIDSYFMISKRGSTMGTEAVGAFTTFAAMSYILMVNPVILSSTGMDRHALVTVTALAAAGGCAMMGLFAKLPIALAPAMGTNTYFAVIVCASMGLSWQQALSLTFYNGLIFLAISLSGIREKIICAVPQCLQVGLQCGIGMFIAFFGLQNAGVIVSNEHTLVGMGSLKSVECLLALAGFALMAVFMSRKFKASIIGVILLLTVVCLFLHDSSGKPISELPKTLFSLPNGISETFLKLDWAYPFRDIQTSLPIIFTLLILDMFDTIGTVVALGRQSGLMDKNARMPNLGKALVTDSCATIFGALLGTSTTGAYVESSAGIESGAKTGLAALLVGIMFLLAMFFTPVIASVPPVATAPALIMVGIMMMKGVKFLNAEKFEELLPAIFCMMMIAFSFNITYGFSLGIIAYVLMMCVRARAKELTPATWLLFAGMVAFLSLTA